MPYLVPLFPHKKVLALARASSHNSTIVKSYLLCEFGRLWYGEPNAVANAIGYAGHRSRSYDAVIRVYDDGGSVIEAHVGHFRQF